MCRGVISGELALARMFLIFPLRLMRLNLEGDVCVTAAVHPRELH